MKELRKIGFARIVKSEKEMKNEWSGTIFMLREALKRKISIEDYIFQWTPIMYIYRMLQKCNIVKRDCDLFNILYANFKIRKKEITAPIIQFDEFPNRKNISSYIFVDLVAEYLYESMMERPNEFRYTSFKNISKRLLKRRACFQNSFFMKAKGIFVMSHWMENYLMSSRIAENQKVVYVGAGINIDMALCDDSKKTGNKILFVGKDFERKGGNLVYKAFQILQKQGYSDIELYILGPKEIPFEIKDRGVYFIGEVSQLECVKYYNLCDIFVMPSNFDAYGIAFIEALCFGLPCIGRDRYEMPYLIEEGKSGLLLRDDSPEKLAEMIKKLLDDHSFHDYVKQHREHYIKEYSWDTVVSRMLDYIKIREMG